MCRGRSPRFTVHCAGVVTLVWTLIANVEICIACEQNSDQPAQEWMGAYREILQQESSNRAVTSQRRLAFSRHLVNLLFQTVHCVAQLMHPFCLQVYAL